MTPVTDNREPETVDLELNTITREVTMVSPPPLFTSWSPDLIALIRRGGSMWCSITDSGVIEMRVSPAPVWYSLTGELDDFGGEIAVRCDENGVIWRAEPR